MKKIAPSKYEIASEIARAIKNQEFILYYQPQVDSETCQIVGAEALIRWQHPEKGLILPHEFIPVAEETGLILEIGAWVLYTACRQNKIWQNKGYDPIQVCVNLSPCQFKHPHLIELVSGALEETQLEPKWIKIEITESSAIDNHSQAVKTIDRFAQMGIEIALDDFGTGYSSLNHLKLMCVQEIKIDRSFTGQIIENPVDRTIAKTVIDLAHNLNLTVTAEGVETWEQFHLLKSEGCDKIQGYYFSRPLPAERIEEVIQRKFFSMHNDKA